MAIAEPKLIEIRCKKRITKIYGAKKVTEPCGALLAKIEHGNGEIRCWRCNHLNVFVVQTAKAMSLVQ